MLAAQQIALDLICTLRPVVATLHVRNPDLADQLVRAATSVVLNLAEGTRRLGRDKKRAYRIAAGEAQEVKAALEVAIAWAYLDEAALAPARALADRVGKTTFGLAR